jgi:hypothetical protein
MASPTQGPDLTPIVRGLLQALEGTLRRAGYFKGLVEAIYREVERGLLPGEKPAMLSFGLAQPSWVERISSGGIPCRPSGIRNAFCKIAKALKSTGHGSSISVALKVKGLEVAGVLRLVRPKARLAPAGFEIEVTTGGQRYAQPLSREPERKRSAPSTDDHIRADERRKLLQASLKSPSPQTFFIERVFEGPAAPSEVKVELQDGRHVLIRLLSGHKKVVGLVAAALVLAGTLTAFPEVLGQLVQAWKRFATGKVEAPAIAPRSVPTPTPLLAPAPTPDARILVSPPPTVAIPGLTLPMTKDSRGDLPVAGYFHQPLSHMPFLSFASSATCTRCVSLIAYPALTDPRPLRFRVEFGDGKTTTLEKVAAVAPGTFDLGRSGLFHLTTPSWYANALFAVTPHEYPDVDTTYLVHVIVEAIEPNGAAETLVILERLLRIEARGVVSTEVTITVPAPAPNTP